MGWPMAMAPPLTLTLPVIDGEILVHRKRLRREGLVGLDQIEVGNLPAGLLKRLARSGDGAGAHDLGIDAGRRP